LRHHELSAKALATKFLQIFCGNYFGFPAGNPIFATPNEIPASRNFKARPSPGVGKRMVR
jgi:hypothetical protein